MSSSVGRRSLAVVAVAAVFAFATTGCDERPLDEGEKTGPVPRAEKVAPTRPVARVAPERSTKQFTAAFRTVGGHLASAKHRAMAALDEVGAEANAEARDALTSTSSAIRRGAAIHLARHGDAGTADSVLAAFASSKLGSAFRSELISAIGRAGTDECIATLVAVIEGESDREAFRAGRELAAFGDRIPREELLAMAGMGNDAYVRGASLLALGPTVHPSEADVFRAAAVDYAPPIRLYAAEGIARLPDVDRQEMAALVDDEDGGVRLAALRALLHCDREWVASVAKSALNDRYDENRVAACVAITERPDSHSYEVLLSVLTNEKQDAQVRGTAARGLLSIDPTRGVGAVEAVASEDSGGARIYCQDALDQFSHDAP